MTLFMLSDGVTCINLDWFRTWEIHTDTNTVVLYDEKSIATHYADDDATALIAYANKAIVGVSKTTKKWINRMASPAYNPALADNTLPAHPNKTNASSDPAIGVTNG